MILLISWAALAFGLLDDEPEESRKSVMHYRKVRHFTGVNRIRSMPQKPTMVAAWGERGNVQVRQAHPYAAAPEKAVSESHCGLMTCHPG